MARVWSENRQFLTESKKTKQFWRVEIQMFLILLQYVLGDVYADVIKIPQCSEFPSD